ncbi:MAG: hypothetical protein ABI868_22055 [Acidobacteriota bacterium]
MRKTESRFPAGLQPADLGEAVTSADGRCTLVSFITAPLAAERENAYVVFVTDAGLAGATQSFEWTFTENGESPTTESTDIGVVAYSPKSPGSLHLEVRLLDAASSPQATLDLDQPVVPSSPELETLIEDAKESSGPTVTNPVVARELINDHNLYYQSAALHTPEPGNAFTQFLFSFVFDGALRRDPPKRQTHLDRLATSLNTGEEDFVSLAAEGAGVSELRLLLLGMVFGAPSPLLAWTELPDVPAQRAVAEEQLRQTLAALGEADRIDLFNVARFPKTNITFCGRILEALRDRYFSGASFNDVMTGMSGTRAHWIGRHFREGPLLHS